MEIPANIDRVSLEKGRQILRAFHNESLKYPNYKISFDELINFYGKKAPFMLEGLGDNLELFGLEMSDAEFYMQEFAINLEGKIPTDWLSFHFAITKAQSNPGFWKTLKYTASETAKQVGTGIVEHGQAAISLIDFSNRYMKFIIFGAAALSLYWFSTRIGRGIEKASERIIK